MSRVHLMRWAFLLLPLLLASCATPPPVSQPVLRPAAAEHGPFVLDGRIAVKHNGQRTSANVHWTHQAATDEVMLSGPLGQTVASLRRDAQGVALQTQEGHYTANDVGELTEQVLGWRLPLTGLRYWVLALPDPASAASIEHDVNGQVKLLRQDDWEIRYTRYAAQTPDSLPLRMLLQREGLEIQLLVDIWEIRNRP